jgi:hypothetical protein
VEAQADDERLAEVARDRGKPTGVRVRAIETLAWRWKRERALTDRLMPLWDDPDPVVAEAALRGSPAFDPRVRAWWLGRLDDAASPLRAVLVRELARRKEVALLARVPGLLRGEDEAVAWAALEALAWLLPAEEELDWIDRNLSGRGLPGGRDSWVEARCEELEAAIEAEGEG